MVITNAKYTLKGRNQLDFLLQTVVGNTENTVKKCWKDLHSNRYDTGFLGLIFEKGSKIGLEGTQMNIQKDAVPTRLYFF